MMVEAGGTAAAWDLYQSGAPKVTEEVIAEGLQSSKSWIRESIELQRELVAAAGVRAPLVYVPQVDYGDDVAARVAEVGSERVESVTTITAKAEREALTEEVTSAIIGELSGEFPGRESEIKAAVRSLNKKLVRQRVATSKVRMDGRGPADLRPLSAAVGVVPTAHGSGLFQRGETQVLNITTLGMPRMDQLLDTIGVDDKKRYMHHYNMPPYANGETGRVGSPKRREIGHGLLAERALLPVVPARRGVPLRPAPGVRGAGVQRLDLDGVGLRIDPVLDGRRGADQGAGRRHRHGAGEGRRPLHHPHRHPRRRGRFRRHGLQGGRHR